MYRIALIPIALLLLLVLAVMLIPLIADKETILDIATSALKKETGATLRVAGDVEVTIFPILGVSLSDVAVALPKQEHYDLRARSVNIGVDLLPLLKGNIKIETVRLDGLIVRAESPAKQSGSDSGLSNIAVNGFAALAVPLTLNIKQLLITDARWQDVDSAGVASTSLELIKLLAKNLNSQSKPVSIEMHLRRSGKQALELTLSGNLRVNQEKQKIHLDDMQVGISGATTVPIQVQTVGSIDLSRETADLQLKFESGQSLGAGSLRYDNAGSPRISAVLQINLLSETLLALTGPEAAGAMGDSSIGADQALPLHAMRLIDTEVVLDIASATFSGQTVTDLHVKLRALKGLIEASDITGNLYGGKLAAHATLDGRDNTAMFKTAGKLTQINIASALTTSKSLPKLSGNAAVTWELSSRGHSPKELVTELNGPVDVTTDGVVLENISIEKSLCKAVALTNNESLTASFPAKTQFESLFANIQITNGAAVLDPLRAQIRGITLTGSGSYDLTKQGFVATFKGRLSEELEKLDRACRMSKRLTAIDWPVSCAGSSETKPADWCHVDTAKIMQDITINGGLEKLEKKASKLLNKLFN